MLGMTFSPAENEPSIYHLTPPLDITAVSATITTTTAQQGLERFWPRGYHKPWTLCQQTGCHLWAASMGALFVFRTCKPLCARGH